MNDNLSFSELVAAISMLEWMAVVSGVLYVLLVVFERLSSWFFAVISSALYVVLCFRSNLYLESMLQLFYVIMGIYGWWSWRNGNKGELEIRWWSVKKHALNIMIGVVCSGFTGYMFDTYTDQANPYVDATVTIFSLSATFMVTRKVIENWLYWILIDALSIYLYASRGLFPSAILYFIFCIIAFWGFFKWYRHYNAKRT